MKGKKTGKKSSKKVPASFKKKLDSLHKVGTMFVNASLMRAYAHKKSKGTKKIANRVLKIQKSLDKIKKSSFKR